MIYRWEDNLIDLLEAQYLSASETTKKKERIPQNPSTLFREIGDAGKVFEGSDI